MPLPRGLTSGNESPSHVARDQTRVLESLVHPIPVNRVGGDVQLVVRVSVGTDDDQLRRRAPRRGGAGRGLPHPQRPAAAGHADLVGSAPS